MTGGNAAVGKVFLGCLVCTAVIVLAVLMSLRWMPSAPALLPAISRTPPLKQNFEPAVAAASSPSPQTEEEEEATWKVLLQKAGGEERNVILTSVNEAWAQPGGMLHLFLRSQAAKTESVRRRLLVACLDAKALQLCLQVHWACFQLRTPGLDFSSEKVYMTPHYVAITWTRKRFMLTLLKHNYTVLSTDTDIMWLRNPVEILEADGDADIQISCDDTEIKEANTGFMYVRGNERSVDFFERWILASKVFPALNDQDVFNVITRTEAHFMNRITNNNNSNNSSSSSGMSMKNVKIKYLDTDNFGGFCKRSSNISDAYTMHANCCKGLHAKTVDLESVLSTWDLYNNYNHTSNSTSTNSSSYTSNSTSTNSSSFPLQWPPPVACPQSWLR